MSTKRVSFTLKQAEEMSEAFWIWCDAFQMVSDDDPEVHGKYHERALKAYKLLQDKIEEAR